MATDTDDPRGFGPGWIGFVVLFLMAVATYLLIRSMTGHLRKVRYSPEPGDPTTPTAPGAPGAQPDDVQPDGAQPDGAQPNDVRPPAQ